MRILLDECTPRVVKTGLPARSITTVQDLGWAGVGNGELLARAEQQFDVLVTTDRSLRYQQNLAGRRLAILVLPTNRIPAVKALLPAIEQALERIRPGMLIELPSA